MRPGKLILNNYLSYKHAEIDLSKFRKALVIGMNNEDPSDSNGSGKTNLFEAIGWNGWGESKAETLDLNVKYGEDVCSVEHQFEHDGKEVSIVRTRNKKNSTTTLDFIIDGVVSNGSSVNDTNRKITEFLRLDYNTFINSVYIKQDDIHSLANTKSNSEGRELIEKVLDLMEYEVYHQKAKDKLKDVEADRDVILAFIEDNKDVEEQFQLIITEIAQANVRLSDATASESKINEDLSASRKEYDKLKEDQIKYENAKANLVSAENDLTSLKGEEVHLRDKANAAKESLDVKKAELEAKIAGKTDIASEQEELERLRKVSVERQTERDAKSKESDKLTIEINELTSKSAELGGKLSSHELRLGGLKGQLADLAKKIKNPAMSIGEKCDICLSDVTEASMEHYKSHFKTQGDEIDKEMRGLQAEVIVWTNDKESFEKQRGEVDGKIKAVQDEVSEIGAGILSEYQLQGRQKLIDDKLENIEGYQKELDEIGTGKQLEEWKGLVRAKKSEIQIKEDAVAGLSKAVSGTNIDYEVIQAHQGAITDIEQKLDEAKDTVHKTRNEIDNNENKKKEFDTIRKSITDKEKELAKLNKLQSTYRELAVAFSPQGIRSFILENAIEELEKEANIILEKLSNGRLSLTFKTKKEVKKSKTGQTEKLTFDVLISDGEKVFPFNSYSGGEKFRISFVLRIALSKLLLRRANSKLEFLIIDEAVSPLDGSGVEKIIEIINELQDEFKTILVITHRTDIKNYFDEIITVHKDKDGSRLEIAN